jgi:hypothetical protein
MIFHGNDLIKIHHIGYRFLYFIKSPLSRERPGQRIRASINNYSEYLAPLGRGFARWLVGSASSLLLLLQYLIDMIGQRQDWTGRFQ